MAQHDSGVGTAVKWGIIGLVGYWIYTQFFAGSAVPATSSSTTPATPVSPPVGTTSSPTPSAPAAPSYSGPSLDQMYAGLQTAVSAAFGADPALTCSVGAGMSGFGATRLQPIYRQHPVQIQPVTVTNRNGVATSPAASMPATCAAVSIQATYDVFNWYLLKANPSITTPPNAPDHTSQITLASYWQWAAPLLKAAIPGLSGLGRHGLGAVWGAMR